MVPRRNVCGKHNCVRDRLRHEGGAGPASAGQRVARGFGGSGWGRWRLLEHRVDMGRRGKVESSPLFQYYL